MLTILCLFCKHVRLSYVINSYVLTYLRLGQEGKDRNMETVTTSTRGWLWKDTAIHNRHDLDEYSCINSNWCGVFGSSADPFLHIPFHFISD